MELTLTGASLNSDTSTARNRRTNANANANANANVVAAGTTNSHSNNHNDSHSHHSHSSVSPLMASSSNDNNANAKSCSHNHDHSHSHTHAHTHANNNANTNTNANDNTNDKACKQQCCGTSNPNPNPANYMDIKAIPKEKLTSNPSLLMNALISSIRGKSTFDTFTYLVQVILSYEKHENDNMPMEWGIVPPSLVPTPNTATEVGDKNNHKSNNTNKTVNNNNKTCKSCINNYTKEGHTIAHWCAKRKDDMRFLEYITLHVPYININLPSLDDVGMRPIHWSCTEGSILNVAFILNYYFHYNTSTTSSSSSSSSVGGSNSNSSSDATTTVSPLQATDNNQIQTQTAIDNHNHNNFKDIINTTDASKCTPLIISSQYGHADLVAFLIKRGANPYAVDSTGDTAFHWAAYKGSVSVCSLLLHLHCYHGNDGNNTSNNSNNGGNDVEYGNDNARDLYGYLDLQDNFGQCPLHLASLRGNIDVVTYILEEAERFVERKLSQQRKESLSSLTSLTAGASTTTASSSTSSTTIGSGNASPNDDTHALLQNTNFNDNNNNIEHYPAMLLSLQDKNKKSPIDLAIKKKQILVELLLRKYQDKHTTYNNASIIGKCKVMMIQFLSLRNWLLWMGLVSEGGGRPPKFIFWWVVGNLFLATLREVFVYANLVWMSMGAGDMDTIISKENGTADVRLAKEYMTLHYITWIGFICTWVTLYLVNQTDPGIIVSSAASSSSSLTSSSSSSSSSTTCASFTSNRFTNWVQLLVRRLCSYLPSSITSNVHSISQSINRRVGSSRTMMSLLYCCNNGAENKRIKREMNSLSTELRRQYEDTLESFASMDSNKHNNSGDGGDGGSDGDKPLLCHSCHVVRPARSKHCRVLNCCIVLFDHHCPFVGTTIGLYNYRYFYLFCWSFALTDILFTITGFLYWKHGPVVEVVTAVTTAAAAETAAETVMDGNAPFEIWTFLIMIYFAMYTLMAGGLALYHTQLVRLNLTTNEHQNMYKYDYMKRTNEDGSVSIKNPFNKGVLHNFMSRIVPGKESYMITKGGSGDGIDGSGSGYGTKNSSHGVERSSSSVSNKKTDDDEGGEKADLVANMV